jgi:AAA family ATP:ADP antiporter
VPLRAPGRPSRWIGRVVDARAGELPALFAGFALFFCLFAGYFMLRPIRETMGITAGVDKLQWLFTATFVTMLLAVPLFGALSARVARRRLLPWVWLFFVANLLAFAAGFAHDAGNVWQARAFYVWLSVFNLFVVSLAWSLLADVFRPDQAKRLFAPMAAGASLGGLVGPLLGAALVGRIGLAGLAVVSAGFLVATLGAIALLLKWRARSGAGVDALADETARPMSGGLLDGLALIARSPYLLAIAGFVVLLATTSTFLYFEQARLVAQHFPDRVAQTQVFSIIDAVVQGLTIAMQVFVTGRLAERYGVAVLLVAVPVVIAVGMGVLAMAPVFGVLVVVMVLRRVGEYALVRPGREMLFVAVDAPTKYKAKNVIDTAVYRGADAISGWVKTGIDALGAGPALVALAGAVVALLWAAVGAWLGRESEASTKMQKAAEAHG